MSNVRGYYGNRTPSYIGAEAPKSSDSSLTGTFITGAFLVGGLVLAGRWALRTMKADEREARLFARRQKFIDMPDSEARVYAREAGLRPGMSQADRDRAFEAYPMKEGRG